MSQMNFTEEDKMKVVDFMNMVAKHAELRLFTSDLVQYFKLLSHMQQRILPKIDANIMEVKRVVDTKPAGPAEGSQQ
jgi:hypothetical protein